MSDVSGNEALEKLLEGNRRFAADEMINPNRSPKRREEIRCGQDPFSIVVTCSDSRIAPVVIFDQGLGDIFVVRVAGNIVDKADAGSIEYAAKHLNVKLVLILGHSNCGAVGAAADCVEVEGDIGYVVDAIKPAVDRVKGCKENMGDAAARENVAMTVERLRSRHPVFSRLVEHEGLVIAGGFYDLETGLVKVIC